MGTSLGVADTMALISSKLSNLVPFAACALFLYDEEHDWLRCRFATGLDSELIGSMTIKSGHGLTGWVTRNRRPLVNARPSADFEAAGLAPTSTGLQVGDRLAAGVQRPADRHAGRLPGQPKTPTPTTTAGCSTGSASRPRR